MIAVSALNVVNPEVVIPAPKQTKLLGARVAGVGIVTSVSAELPWCFALVSDAEGHEHHVFIADLKKDNVTFPAEPQAYREVKRRGGYGLIETVRRFTDHVSYSTLVC